MAIGPFLVTTALLVKGVIETRNCYHEAAKAGRTTYGHPFLAARLAQSPWVLYGLVVLSTIYLLAYDATEAATPFAGIAAREAAVLFMLIFGGVAALFSLVALIRGSKHVIVGAREASYSLLYRTTARISLVLIFAWFAAGYVLSEALHLATPEDGLAGIFYAASAYGVLWLPREIAKVPRYRC